MPDEVLEEGKKAINENPLDKRAIGENLLGKKASGENLLEARVPRLAPFFNLASSDPWDQFPIPPVGEQVKSVT